MSANVKKDGTSTTVDAKRKPIEQITESQVTDAKRLAQLLQDGFAAAAATAERFAPNRVDFEDRSVDASGTQTHSFAHRLGKRVRWWAVDWTGTGGGPELARHDSTTNDTLVLVSYRAGTVTLRVEEAE
jgi:hypothetical protein